MAVKLQRHLSIAEQIDKLESRGLVIENRDKAEDFLIGNFAVDKAVDNFEHSVVRVC